MPSVMSKTRELVSFISSNTQEGPSEVGGVTVGRRTRRRAAMRTSRLACPVTRFVVRSL